MKTKEMPSIPANSNPFYHDQYHMGTKIGENCYVMYSNHENAICNYLIIVNIDTGDRLRVALTDEGEQPSLPESIITI